jgi:rhodanese-related sulfurtransferase
MRPIEASRMVVEAQNRVEGLTPTDVAAALDGETILVDVREPEECLSGVIGGAIVVPRGLLEFHADPTCESYDAAFDKARRLILCCSDGSRSALAADTLIRMGYWRVSYLKGGLESWINEERGLEAPGSIPLP